MRRAGTCPLGPDDPAAQLVAQIETAPGRANTLDDYPGAPGPY